MLFGNRRPRNVNARRLTAWSFQPRGELLEMKVLLAAIDLGGTSPPLQPRTVTTPYGIDLAGATPSAGAGWSVADIADVTNTRGYDDILIGAPTLNGSPSKLGTAAGGSVYLIFGSATGTAATLQNWLNTTAGPNLNSTGDRLGDLAQLITPAAQTNPISGTPLTFPFSGVTFTATGVDATSSFGASVAEVKLSSGFGILIGAPNAPSGPTGTANPGTGKVFLISGNFAAAIGHTIDVDTPATYAGLTVVTIGTTGGTGGVNVNGQLGYSVAGGLNILGDGLGDVIIGAPQATVPISTNNSIVTKNTGAVYVISVALLNTSSNNFFDVSTSVGQAGTQSVVFAGEATGDEAGWSVADAGNVNQATGNVDDLLIGAPQNLNEGAAYLIYGGANLGNLATTPVNTSVRYISLGLVGGTATGSVPGAKITGPDSGGQTGFSVSPGGDFNGDGFPDFLIGTPFTNAGTTLTNQGEVDLIYGAASGITGTFSLSSLPATVQGATFTGANPGDLAGYAISQVGVINAGQPTGILIGAPGFSSDSGTAYLIMGRTGLTGTFSLATEQSAPLSGLQFASTTPNAPGGSPPFFGASLSSRIQGTQQNTVDLDKEADFVIGAPGYDVTQNAARNLAGGAQIVQSGFLVVPIPAPSGITAPIGVGTPFAPFSISATTPANLQIFVFGVAATATAPQFSPVTDIDPTTVKVNGIAFPNATLVKDPNTADYTPPGPNGIPDAIITISPRSNLNLTPGTATIVISGKTLATAPAPNETWTGSATVTVTGSSGGGSTSAVVGVPTGPVLFTDFIPTFGANQYTPSLAQLSALSYQPLPLAVALQQFGPAPGFAQRNYSYYHPGKTLGPQYISRGQNTRPDGGTRGITTLSSRVFDRSRFHAQKTYTYTHKAPKAKLLKGVVPVQSRTEKFVDNLLH
jgi:FG-GAP repeat